MSVRSLTDLAVERDSIARDALVPAAGGRRRGRAARDATHETLGDVVISSIPSEVIATYTAISALVEPLVEPDGDSYLPLRWWLFAVFTVVTMASVVMTYRRKRASQGQTRRKFPATELVAASVAFIAWALVMPRSPLVSMLPGHLIPLVTALITAGALAVLSGVTGRPMRRGAMPRA